jgi:hypothetical protein
VLGGAAFGLVVVVWWLFFSRAPWPDRIGAIVLMVIAVIATKMVVHPSIANGMMGMMLPMYSIPALSLALVAAAVISRHLPIGARRALMASAIVIACLSFTLLRTGGITGDASSDLHWRWTETPEERLLAQDEPTALTPAPAEPLNETPSLVKTSTSDQPTTPEAKPTEKSSADPAEAKTADWSGFRGPQRDGVIRGARIQTDWTGSKPVEMWRRPIGPGWSSFAVRGDLVYTQEQRGNDEVVSCYNLTTGPRGTPTLSNNRVYTFGATGILNALDARNGSIIWSRNAASDTNTKVPDWGFASSPLVVGDVVIVATAGVLAAYDLATGNPRWQGPAGRGGYSSPQLATIGGVAQVLLLNGEGATSVAPTDGKLLWKYDWKGDGIVQPAVITGNDVLLGSGSGLNSEVGIRRVAVTHSPGGWNVEERWTSNSLKPYYNDFVVHKGHAFGFDGSILACVDLADGKRKWKGGRYGHGQLIVLPDQDVLLVLSEEGELALVSATTDQFTELARIPAMEGKTWNHPVLVGDVLLGRNSQEMVAFRLSLATH